MQSELEILRTEKTMAIAEARPTVTLSGGFKRFEAEFKNSPPKGSVIRVAFHEYSKENIDQYDCGANKAVDSNLNN